MTQVFATCKRGCCQHLATDGKNYTRGQDSFGVWTRWRKCNPIGNEYPVLGEEEAKEAIADFQRDMKP
jgi:hypothetical protein